jgi:hypothetical protein
VLAVTPDVFKETLPVVALYAIGPPAAASIELRALDVVKYKLLPSCTTLVLNVLDARAHALPL